MSDESRGERSPFNVWWAVAGGFLAAVVIALVAVLVLGQGHKTNDADKGGGGGGTSQTVPPASSPSTSDTTTGCDLPAGSQSIPTSGPPATWKNNIYLVLPQSASFGPVAQPSSKWGCFAHSPTGALFAAASFVGHLANPDYAAFVKDGAIDNTARAQWLGEQDPSDHAQEAGHVAQIAGFQFVSVQANAVIVNIGAQQDSAQGAFKVSLVWDSATNNWKADIGSSDLTVAAADLTGYTKWAASNG